jgi:hypothetical protein
VKTEYQELRLLFHKYWELAYNEGVEGRDFDTENADAQKTLVAFDEALRKLEVERELMISLLLWNWDNFNDLPIPETYFPKWLERATPLVDELLRPAREQFAKELAMFKNNHG